jgi:tetratricopeptide (TPR) repeat protein
LYCPKAIRQGSISTRSNEGYVMKYSLELELRQYRQIVVGGLASSTRQQAQMLSRQDDGLTALIGGLNYVGSGLAGIENGLDVIGADLARLVTAVDSALPSIVEYLAISAEEIKNISQMMATPEETRAAERFRTGTMALAKAQQAGSPTRAQQWYDLAVHDLREAVEIHKYHTKSWFNLGITLGRLGRTEEAAEAFTSSAFFGVDQSLEFGATAVLLAAGLYRQANLGDKSADILHEYLDQLDRCAEIHLALAMHHSESDQLTEALVICPYLAADAIAAKVPNAKSVIEGFCNHADGPVKHLLRLQQAIRGLAGGATALGMRGVSPIPDQVHLPAVGVDALLSASTALPSTQEVAKRLSVEVNDSIRQLERAADEAKTLQELAPKDGATRVEQARRMGEAQIAQARAAGAEEIARTKRTSAERIQRAQRELESKRKMIAQADREAISVPDQLRHLEQKLTADLEQVWQLALERKRADEAGKYEHDRRVLWSIDERIAVFQRSIREYRSEIGKIVLRSEMPWLHSAVSKVRLEEKARRAHLKVAQLNNDTHALQHQIQHQSALEHQPPPIVGSYSREHYDRDLMAASRWIEWSKSALLTICTDLVNAQAEADKAAQVVESLDPENGPELWREQRRQWCAEAEQKATKALRAAEAQAELALRLATIQADTAVRDSEAEVETALQTAKDQAAEILRLAERSADAAQARVLQVRSTVSGQIAKLEGIIALILPSVERIVPFDLQGF